MERFSIFPLIDLVLLKDHQAPFGRDCPGALACFCFHISIVKINQYTALSDDSTDVPIGCL